MADFPTTSTQSELVSAGLNPNAPAQTYIDFAQQLAKNQQEQAAQEQAIARATELTKQAQIQTQQQQEATAQGLNPLLVGTMSPDEAVAAVRLIFKEKGLTVPEDDITAWAATLPERVNRQDVEDFASRFARETTRSGQPFVATAADASSDKRDENGDPLKAGETYAALFDNQGSIQAYIRSGKVAPDMSLKTSEKDNQFWTNQWKMRIANKINPYLASARTQVGVALQSYVRCVRALETLAKKPVTKQDATNVIMEIGSVYKGGSPDQSAILATSYQTLFGDFQNWTQSLLGRVRDTLPESIRQHLVDRITDLEDQSKKVVTDSLSAAEALNSDVIDHFPDQWKKFKDEIDKELQDPNNVPLAGGTTPVVAVTAPAVTPKASTTVPSYTVEE